MHFSDISKVIRKKAVEKLFGLEQKNFSGLDLENFSGLDSENFSGLDQKIPVKYYITYISPLSYKVV